ncbi:hypothetical protein JOF56_009947 [Kibdelosporangium banguiense]|uniref:MarR family transcriptional regulator n=1 Tax=Kibdelosporangium banguiense TaxID=1365924 RepID=A0ABS4TYS6_9PSEU|nr:hypothetical protein [Kibdelosporangium banguiense]MBP2329562.1 hypothetical protein [Kibdelosporangium banguiense]
MSVMLPDFPTLSRRELAMLRAIAAGRATITCSCAPDLFIDGLPCCDQSASRHLAHAGLVRATIAAKVGQLVPAELTGVGHALLATWATPP